MLRIVSVADSMARSIKCFYSRTFPFGATAEPSLPDTENLEENNSNEDDTHDDDGNENLPLAKG